ncbi:hypothetical protein Pyn_28967 [Prunus yedoensis var. nudiflora]|uniref:EF-hand domain-containing protein n=1 Tax=Prunus yedoensis var. nudiflora TaxID=2094558 RepID=A0A314ZDN1_PRUYE|nr:hypothetical protein Pyn_28967 [Prunus yedoensis var. nudiflora]
MIRGMVPQISIREEVKFREAHVPWRREMVVEVFKSFAKDGQQLSKHELKEAFDKLGSRWSTFRAWRALSYADANQDGLISNDHEFKALVNYALECGYEL